MSIPSLPEATQSAPSTPARTGEAAYALVTTALAIGGYFTVGAATQLMNAAFGVWFTELYVFAGVPWVMAKLLRRDPSRELPLGFPGWESVLFAFAAGTVNLFTVVFPLQAISQRFVPEWLKAESVDVSKIFERQTHFELGFLVAGVSVVAPICEELLFRGVLQRGLLKLFRTPVLPIALTAVLFSALHLDAVGFLARAELGVLFGILAYQTGSIWPGVFAHAANNLVSTMLYFLAGDEAGPDTGELPPWRWVLLAAAVGIPLVVAFLRASIHWAKELVSEPPRIPEKAPSFYATVAPWLATALLSVAGLWAVDHRGIKLNFEDQLVPVPEASEHPDAEEKQLRKELDDARAEARAGKIPISEYVQRRREAALELKLIDREQHPKAKPPKPVPEPVTPPKHPH